jgi:hypothetical protein
VYLALEAEAGKRHWKKADSAPEELGDGVVQAADMRVLVAVSVVGPG